MRADPSNSLPPVNCASVATPLQMGISRQYAVSQSILKEGCDTCILSSICIQSVMIKSFRHKGLQRFFETGVRAGIQSAHASRLRLQLAALDQARKPADMGATNWRLHPLKGDLKRHWSVWVSGNWRLTFKFEGEDAVLVDYH